MVAAGSFREDLLYRLSVFHIHLPPLRERRDDIPLLAEHFLRGFAAAATTQFAPEAIAVLLTRPWQGNVRELRNAVEHAAIMARGGTIHPEHLPPPITTAAPAGGDLEDRIRGVLTTWVQQQLGQADPDPDADSGELYERYLSLVESPLLEATLLHTGGNRANAAKLLGIHRATLRQKLRENAE
jgi:two-component system nitrogen regulation response regulator GlnG